jgi:hypothetical protein
MQLRPNVPCLGGTRERVMQVQVLLDNVPYLHDTTVNAMLSTIVQSVQLPTSAALRRAALKALYKSMPFCRGNMEVPAERDTIVNPFFLIPACDN